MERGVQEKMIIGFGFGSPLTALLMLLVTGFISYSIYRMIKNSRRKDYTWNQNEYNEDYKEKRRQYYYEQRERARRLMEEFDLTDEEIEKKIEEEIWK
jgi:hypothetical protein